MSLDEFSGGKRKRVVKTTKRRVVKRVVKRKSSRTAGGRVLTRKPVRRAKAAEPKVRTRRKVVGKPRGDISGAKYVGKRIKEETAKKGRRLTRPELSKLFKDAWAEHKAKKMARGK
jgi:hypothetical protein